jgi:hypothetical protein
MDRLRLFALVGFLAAVPLCSAALDDVVLTIEATTMRAADGVDGSYGCITVTQQDGWWEGNTFYWETSVPLAIGDTGATFGPAVVTSYVDPESGRSFPSVSLGFAVSAGDVAADFTISSALLSFPLISPAFARASAAFTVTDFFGTGTTLTGLGGVDGMAYRAFYNGYLDAGTEFCGLIDQVYALAGSSGVAEDYPGLGMYLPIGSAYDMSSEISFNLTAFGLASGSATFDIIPEPGTVLLLIVGFGLLRRR